MYVFAVLEDSLSLVANNKILQMSSFIKNPKACLKKKEKKVTSWLPVAPNQVEQRLKRG